MKIYKKIFIACIVSLFLFVIKTNTTHAICYVNDSGGPDTNHSETCTSTIWDLGGGNTYSTATGTTIYACDNYLISETNQYVYGCYWNEYTCTNTTCAGDVGGSCFPAGTNIKLEDGTDKKIEDVKIGDKVLSQNESGKKSSSLVTKLIQPVSDNICTISFTDGEKLEVTKSHPFLTDKGWAAIDKNSAELEKPGVEVSFLKSGDTLFKDNGDKPTIQSISCRSEKVQTYNFTVDNDHTYFANGFLAHNKGAYNYNSCAPGQQLTAYSPMGTMNGGQCTFGATCDGYFPSQLQVNGCDGNQNKGVCNVSYLCCSPGQVVNCTGNTQITRGGTTACEAGEVTVSTGKYQDGSPYVVCKQNCTCGSPAPSCSAPTILSKTLLSDNRLQITWKPGDKGRQQLIRIGEDRDEVTTGCYGTTLGNGGTACISSQNFPLYNFPSPINQQMYYFSQSSNSCSSSYITSSTYTDVNTCNNNLTSYIPTSSEICYTSVANCNQYNTTSYTTTTPLTPGKNYYIRVVNTDPSTGCVMEDLEPFPVPVPSCSVTVTSNLASPIDVGNNPTITANVTATNGTVTNVVFSSSNTSTATLNPQSDSTSPYSTTLTTLASGTTSITANVYMNGVLTCTNTSTPLVITTKSTPVGNLDSADCTSIKGWACDGDNYSTPLTIHLYDGPGFSSNIITSTIVANTWNTGGASACRSNTKGFSYTTPQSLKDGANHAIYAYAINIGPTGSNPLLTGSPITINCPPPVTITDPWWQVKDGDVTTNGSMNSNVPNTKKFATEGLGGYHGLPLYGTTFNLYPDYLDRISTLKWNSNSTTTQSRLYNYAFFKGLIPSDVAQNITVATDTSIRSTGFTYDGYEWFKATGDFVIPNNLNLTSRKVILFVEGGDLSINANVNLTDGLGFFGAFVEGDISVGGSVTGAPALEGIYLTNGTFTTGTGTVPLHIRGSVAAFGSAFTLQRNLTDDSVPAELFEFAPDQMLLFPRSLMARRSKWTEVAP